VGHDGAFLLLAAGASIALVLLFQWVERAIRPPMVDYVKNRLWAKAREWFNESGLAFMGFTIKSCVISLLLAYVFYILLKTLFRFPGYMAYSGTALLAALIVFSIVGYSLCGKSMRLSNFMKYFYIPATGGIGVLVANFFSENLVNFLGAVMHAINGT
jgi:hypothetical protein